MKGLPLALLLLSPTPQQHDFRSTRAVTVAPGAAQRACMALDGELYAHAAPALADVRLFSAGRELPYALTLSETATGSDPARVLNRGMRKGHVVFDLAMPARPYSDIVLDLDSKDFLAAATVSGGASPAGIQTGLGTVTLFDLSAQHLGRSTALTLGEASFPYLHVELSFSDPAGRPRSLPPETVRAAEVPPSRRAQTLYTTVAETRTFLQRGRATIAVFDLPAHVPVERVSIALATGDRTNFSRSATLSAKPQGAAQDDPYASEELSGTFARLHLPSPLNTEGAARPIDERTLSIPATLGANGRAPARVELAIENGDNRPLALTSARLEMRARNLCFDVPDAPAQLMFGDAGLTAPQYDFGLVFSPADEVRRATLGAQQPNPAYTPPADARSFTERHPEVVWAALVLVAALLGLVAWRSGRKV